MTTHTLLLDCWKGMAKPPLQARKGRFQFYDSTGLKGVKMGVHLRTSMYSNWQEASSSFTIRLKDAADSLVTWTAKQTLNLNVNVERLAT